MKKLYIVGVGSGNFEDLTIKANKVLMESECIYCDELLYQKLYLYFKDKLLPNSYNATNERCNNAILKALKNNVVSILGSGDTGIYGISNIILDKLDKIDDTLELEIIPGITSAISGAALLGSPLTKDFAVISLSNNFGNKQDIEKKIRYAALADFNIVFYSPCNPDISNLLLAKEILLSVKIVGIANNIGCREENIIVTNLSKLPYDRIHSFSTIFVGNSQMKLTKNRKTNSPLY